MMFRDEDFVFLQNFLTAPELNDYLKIFRPKRLTLKGYKQYWFKFQDISISYFKSKEESTGEPIQRINLKGTHSLYFMLQNKLW